MADNTGRAGQAQGQQKVHQMTRINPTTGEVEHQDVTQEDWRKNGQQLRAEGWTRPEDVEDPAVESGGEGS
jgi:hypothetical protein